MISTRDFERMIFRCPEVNMLEYPLASGEEFQLMEHDFSSEFICIYPFVRDAESGKSYVEIYIWDMMLYPDNCERFIICEGKRLPIDLENLLLKYCKESYIYIDKLYMERFNTALLECFPQWHCVLYSSDEIGKCIEHIYYASHPSGPREILYKAGLENIAYHLSEIPRVNLIGGTAPQIIGDNVPIKLLRILNQVELISTLYKEESMEHALGIYKEYSGVIGKSLPTANQWRYLDELYSGNNTFANMSFNRSLYKYLGCTGNNYIIDVYRRYFELYEELKIEKRLRIPKTDELWEAIEKLERFQDYSEDRTDLDFQFRARKKTSYSLYEYSDDTYTVILPDSCADICKEAIAQDNCLMNYICAHASGETTILFLRKRDNPNESYVTMEVKNWQIKQVYGCCNTIPRKDVYQFLVEKYSKDKCFLMDLHEIMENLNEYENEIDDDLLEYLSGQISKNTITWITCDKNDRDYFQFDLTECFPNLLDE